MNQEEVNPNQLYKNKEVISPKVTHKQAETNNAI